LFKKKQEDPSLNFDVTTTKPTSSPAAPVYTGTFEISSLTFTLLKTDEKAMPPKFTCHYNDSLRHIDINTNTIGKRNKGKLGLRIMPLSVFCVH
jgi:hypothetical protein